LGLTYSKLSAFFRHSQDLTIKNSQAYQAILKAAEMDNCYAQYMLAYNYKKGSSMITQNCDRACY
jgi:TPR repeat protein